MSLHRLTVPYHLVPELQSKAWNVTWCLSMYSKNGPMGCLLFGLENLTIHPLMH